MKYLLGVIILLGLLGCKQKIKQANNKQTDSVVSAKTNTSLTSEFLDWYKVKLNGTIDLLSSFKITSQSLGKPDSIITPNYEDISVSYFNGEKFKYVYYKGLQFELVNDSLAFREIDFSKDTSLYFTSDKIRLGYSTSLNDFKKIFPKAGDNELHHTAMDKYIVVDLNVSEKIIEDQWMLSFSPDGSKLLRIEYFIPD
jgi:hypothetical protein